MIARTVRSPLPKMLSRPGSPRPRPDQDQAGRDQDQDQDQHGRDQDQHPRPRPRPLLSWSRTAHINSFHSSTFEYCTAVNVIGPNAQKHRNRSVKQQISK